MKLKAPDEARLPFYHNYKLAIGWVLFVLILFVALLLVRLLRRALDGVDVYF